MSNVTPIPEGFHSITPHLVCRNCAQAIEFYKKAFGATELGRMAMPGSDKLMHAMVKIGDSMVMLVDENPEWGVKSPQSLGGSPVTIHLYVPNADAMMNQAVAAGAKVTMPLMDAFWGDRYGKVDDPFGHSWSIAHHMKDVPPEQMAAEAQKAFAQMPGK